MSDQCEGQRAARTQFCIVTHPRSGSNHLCALLNDHPEITCHYEIFNPSGIFSEFENKKRAIDRLRRAIDPIGFLNDLRTETFSIRPQTRSFGFKMFFEHSRRAFRHVCHTHEIQKIVLVRRNKLARYSSFKIAKATGQYSSDSMTDSVTTRIEFVAQEFHQFIEYEEKNMTGIRRLLNNTKQKWLEVRYEELDSIEVHHSILDFIQMPLVRLHNRRSLVQNPRCLLERFTNPDAVVATLGGREDWWTSDDGTGIEPLTERPGTTVVAPATQLRGECSGPRR